MDGKEEEPKAVLAGTQQDLEDAWAAFTQMEATGWRFLPYAGGLLDQPELLMKNIFAISRVAHAKQENHATQ